MKPVEDVASRDAAAGTDFSTLDEPDFAAWAAGQEVAPPELPDFPAWEVESTPEEPEAFCWERPVEEPAVVGEPEAAVSPEQADGDRRFGEQERDETAETEALAVDRPLSDLDVAPGVAASGAAVAETDARLEPPVTGDATAPTASPPAEAAEPPPEARRSRLRELAARLWTAKPRTDAAGEPHLICVLGKEEFALPLGWVREVQRLPAVTPVPHLPGWLLGVTNRRGDVLSVVDLAAFLGLPSGPPSPARRLIVVQAGGDELTTGLVVDRVRGLRVLPPDQIEPPALDFAPHVRGVSVRSGAAAVVLDLDELLLSPRMQRPDLDEADAALAERPHALFLIF